MWRSYQATWLQSYCTGVWYEYDENLHNFDISYSLSILSVSFNLIGGDNLAADFSRELADYTIYVIDTAGGDKVPRKGGPGITQSDLLVINKIDLAEGN